MKRPFQTQIILIALISLISGWQWPSIAADPPAPMENRFLFVLDTSSAMKKRSEPAQQAIVDLVRNKVNGQMSDGDTFGIWTYNDKLNPEFPMQLWSDQNKQKIIDAAASFLHARQFEKKAHLERAMPAILSAVRASQTLVVVLITEGSEPIKGTPFDDDINDLLKKYGRDLRKAQIPFAIVLACRDGKMFDYTVNSAVSQIRIPQTALVKKPAPKPPAPVPVAKIDAPPPPPQQVMAAPLIFIHPPTNSAADPQPIAAPKAAAKTDDTQPAPDLSNPQPIPAAVPPPIAQSVASTQVLANPNPAPVAPAPSQPAPVLSQAAPAQFQVPPIATLPSVNSKPISPPVSTETVARKNAEQPNATTPTTQVDSDSDHAQPLPRYLRLLLMLGGGLLAVTLATVFYLMHRLRNNSQPSLISQSFNKERL